MSQTMRRFRFAAIVVIAICCVFGWFVCAMDYGDGVISGTYHFSTKAESCDLVLRNDHTFHQRLERAGKVQQANGTWRKAGEGSVDFSLEFLQLAGTEQYPSSGSYADIEKLIGLFPSLHFRQYIVLWYGRKDSSSDTIGPGIYLGDEEGVNAKLEMKADHSFEQTIGHAGVVKQASGTWHTDVNGFVSFSKDFLKDNGEPLALDETASSMPGSNLQIEIRSNASEPIFHKQYLGL